MLILMTRTTWKAQVRGGRLVLDEPVDLPDGTVLELVALDADADTLADQERAAMHAALDRSLRSADAGNLIPADEALVGIFARSR